MDYIDYNDMKMNFIGLRKHFFKDKFYFIYVFEEFIVMATTEKSQKPKYHLRLSLDTKIQWNIKITKQETQLESFSFYYKNKLKEMNCNSQDLNNLRDYLCLKVTFLGINLIYQPIIQVGKGSSAKVYSAKNLYNLKIVAVKVIQKTELKKQNEQGLPAFKLEVQILKSLQKFQDYFIGLNEIFEDDIAYYLVCPFIQGPSLSQELEHLRDQGQNKFPLIAIKQMMKKLMKALQILHFLQIIHRDLKPENLMFLEKGNYSSLIIVDFGLATSEQMEKFLFPKCGTPGYVAPEVLIVKQNEKYTSKVDIFSSGCILYKLLTGNSAFLGLSYDEVLKSNRNCLINFNLLKDPEYLTENSIKLLAQMLCKNPINRISAKQALSHPFFDEINQKSQLKAKQNLVLQIDQNHLNPSYDYSINDEKQASDSNSFSLPNIKKFSFIFSMNSPTNKALEISKFYQKDPLSCAKSQKFSVSPITSQILE